MSPMNITVALDRILANSHCLRNQRERDQPKAGITLAGIRHIFSQ